MEKKVNTVSSEMAITRKEAIKRTGALAGGLVISPMIVGFLQGCSPSSLSGHGVLFSEDQRNALLIIMDILIPETDTPSASQAGVLNFIEVTLDRNSSEDSKQAFLNRFDHFLLEAERDLGKPFLEVPGEIQAQFLREIHETAYGQGDKFEETDLPDFLNWIRYLCVTGYFTSKPGATQVLRYAAMPGPYRGCVPFEEVGKTWAT